MMIMPWPCTELTSFSYLPWIERVEAGSFCLTNESRKKKNGANSCSSRSRCPICLWGQDKLSLVKCFQVFHRHTFFFRHNLRLLLVQLTFFSPALLHSACIDTPIAESFSMPTPCHWNGSFNLSTFSQFLFFLSRLLLSVRPSLKMSCRRRCRHTVFAKLIDFSMWSILMSHAHS